MQYTTKSGIRVTQTVTKLPYARGLKHILKQLDTKRGVYLSSGYEYPERYSRWDIASVAPPLEITAEPGRVSLRALNDRGRVLLRILNPLFDDNAHWSRGAQSLDALDLPLNAPEERFPEEKRSKQPSPFSVLRRIIDEFRDANDCRLGLIGAFGYDLLLEFDPIRRRLPRESKTFVHLYLCDEIYFADRKKEVIERFRYDFALNGADTIGLPRTTPKTPKSKTSERPVEIVSDHTPDEYMAKVQTLREGMRQGEYYEVVLRQTFRTPFNGKPSELFQRIQQVSPSPYEFFLQLGDEQLIGASPEMFLRVEDDRVETCPIAGTARRSGDPLRDAESIRQLLNSTKEESELTMCSDVDRNDKSRVCEPGSVRVIGRRLIESYAGLFHTVDHVEGRLMNGFDSLEAFLSHMWAVTVVGAPKKAAAQAIEDLEKDARGWYGGAVGVISLNGDINTGIAIRTAHLKDGIARYSAGATLLYDSDPASENAECRLKATAFFRSLQPEPPRNTRKSQPPDTGVKVLLIDNDDCFVHTLANYVRQTGANVVTYRADAALQAIDHTNPDIVLISPGPGRPADFELPQMVRELARREIPTFGVCLGLQAMIEAFGGELAVLDYPMHGKSSLITCAMPGLPSMFRVGRYHSLYASRENLPSCFEITAESEDGIIMGIRHRDLPMEAVQFHPESILSLEGDCGFRLIAQMIQTLASNVRSLEPCPTS